MISIKILYYYDSELGIAENLKAQIIKNNPDIFNDTYCNRIDTYQAMKSEL